MIASAAAALGGAIGGYGKKIKVPSFTPIDPVKVQQDAVTGNLAAIPGAEKLASEYNKFNVDELKKALDFWMPGASSKISSNLMSDLMGELSPDVSAAVGRSSVAKGFASGVGGGRSGIGRNLVLRDLGLTSQQTQQRGLQNFATISQALKTPQFDVSSMFFSAPQRLAAATEERNNQFSRDLLAAQIEAAPDPATKAIAEGIMADDAYWGSMFSGVMGGSMGGGGGAPKSSGGGGGRFGGGSSWG